MIQFTVIGTPATAGSKKPFIYKSKKDGKYRASMAPDNKRQKPWMSLVSMTAAEVHNRPVLTCPLVLAIDFYFVRPKSHFRADGWLLKKGAPRYHVKKPDLCKLIRAVEDALTGIVWRDDSQICRYGRMSKRWSIDGMASALITIYEAEDGMWGRDY